MPSLGMAEALSESCWIFSWRVSRDMRDLALVLIDREVLQNGYESKCGGLHGKSGLFKTGFELEKAMTLTRTKSCRTRKRIQIGRAHV